MTTARAPERRRVWPDCHGSWGMDLRFSLRSLSRTPGVTAAVVLMLAVGIGGSAAVFGLLDRLFLQPPPHIEDPESVRRVYVRQVGGLGGPAFTNDLVDWNEFSALHADEAQFSSVMGYTFPTATRHGLGQAAEEVYVSWVSGEFFAFLGVRPARGRLIGPGDDDLAAAPVAVISDGYWRRRFDRGSQALGAIVSFDEVTYTIVGVTPPGFSGPDPSAADVWLPLTQAATGSRGDSWRRSGSGFSLRPLVRLAPGVTLGAAATATTSRLRAVRADSPFRDVSATALLGPILATRGPAGVQAAMQLPLLVGGVAAIVLLIATANVANLLLLRAGARRRELAVRYALGAGRWRVVRLLVLESVCLAVVSAVAALGVAALTGRVLRTTLLPRYNWASDPIDLAVLVFTGIAALLIGVATGLVPAVQAGRKWGLDDLRAGMRSARPARSPLRVSLLVVQTALSLILLMGAAVFYRSFDAARHVDIGYAKEHLLTVTLDSLGNFGRPLPAVDDSAVRLMQARVRALPGVTDVAQGTNTPLGGAMAIPLRVEGTETLPRMNGPYVNFVTPSFFNVTDLRVLKGRAFIDTDLERAPMVAIVNDTLAQMIWPDGNAVGGCLYVGRNAADCATVVGVVESPREFGLGETAKIPQYYLPIAQALSQDATSAFATTRRTLVARTAGDPGQLVRPVLAALGELFPDLPRDRVRTLTQAFAPRIRSWKIGAGLFGGAAGLALALAAIGLYTVVTFSVRQRELEFGVRRALGAQASDLVRLVLVQGFTVAAAGVVVGGVVSWWASRFVSSLLFEARSPRDPIAFAVAAVVLLAVALAASVFPARRAARVDPRQALQAE